MYNYVVNDSLNIHLTIAEANLTGDIIPSAQI